MTNLTTVNNWKNIFPFFHENENLDPPIHYINKINASTIHKDIWAQVFSHLDLKSSLNFSSTCKSFRALLNDFPRYLNNKSHIYLLKFLSNPNPKVKVLPLVPRAIDIKHNFMTNENTFGFNSSNTLYLWNTDTDNVLKQNISDHSLNPSRALISSLTYFDGTIIAGMGNGTIFYMDENLEITKKFENIHDSSITAIAVAKNKVISASGNSVFKFTDLHTGEVRSNEKIDDPRITKGIVNSINIFEEKLVLFIGNSIFLFDLRTNAYIKTLDDQISYTNLTSIDKGLILYDRIDQSYILNLKDLKITELGKSYISEAGNYCYHNAVYFSLEHMICPNYSDQYIILDDKKNSTLANPYLAFPVSYLSSRIGNHIITIDRDWIIRSYDFS